MGADTVSINAQTAIFMPANNVQNIQIFRCDHR